MPSNRTFAAVAAGFLILAHAGDALAMPALDLSVAEVSAYSASRTSIKHGDAPASGAAVSSSGRVAGTGGTRAGSEDWEASETAAGHPASAPRSISVTLDDRVNVPTRELAVAKTVVERAFRDAGISIAWTEGAVSVPEPGPAARPDSTRPLTVILMASAKKPVGGANSCVLGLAMAAIARAYVFHDRILDATLMRPADAPTILGRVIAHEVGHLVLPPGSHSRFGIMRADLDLGYLNPNRFTADQARLMRARLAIAETDD
jgi:hypothetical protein